jgi:hypothetical protein
MVGLRAVSGCVVADKIEFYEPVNSPPVFPAEQPSKIQIGQIVYVDKNDGSPGWSFTFRVRDADVKQELSANWRIRRNTNPNDPSEVNEKRSRVTVQLTGTDTRDFLITVDPVQLVFDNCHRVEIAVSGSFEEQSEGEELGFTQRDDRDDLALFSFWIWEGDPSAPDAAKLVETCGAQLFRPTVPTGAGGSAGMGGAAAEGTQ